MSKPTKKIAYLNLSGIVYNEQSKGTEDYGVITKRQVVDFINANQSAEQFNVTIHSRGGDVSEGFAIYDALRTSGKRIKTIGEGLVASIATVIFMAGDERSLTENTDFFIHCPWGEPWQMSGFTADDYQAMADSIRQAEEKLLKFYVNKTGADETLLSEYMKEEKTFTAEQAIELKFATDLIKTNNKKSSVGAFAFLGGFSTSNNQNSKTSDQMNKTLKAILDAVQNLGTEISKRINAEDVQDSTIEITLDDDTIMIVNDPDGDGVAMVDDTVTIDGSAPADGDYTEKDSGTVYSIAGGMITAITPVSAEDSKDGNPTPPANETPAAKALRLKNEKDPKFLADRIPKLSAQLKTANENSKKNADQVIKLKAEKDELEKVLPTLQAAIEKLTKDFITLAKNTGSDHDINDRNDGDDLSHHDKPEGKGGKQNLATKAAAEVSVENAKKKEKAKKSSLWATPE